MKILHAVLSQGFYGSERYCAELAAEQARDGHDVEVLIHGAWSDCAREMRKSVALANTVGAGTHAAHGHSVVGADGVCIACWRAARCGGFGRTSCIRISIRRRGASGARRKPSTFRMSQRCILSYAKRELGDCDGLICIAGWQLDTLEGFTGEVAVVHNWVPTVVVDALTETTDQQIARLRRSWNADDDTFVLGTVGRLMPEKGIDRLVRIFRAIFSRGDEPIRLVIVGDGPQRDEIEQIAAGRPAHRVCRRAGERRAVLPRVRHLCQRGALRAVRARHPRGDGGRLPAGAHAHAKARTNL